MSLQCMHESVNIKILVGYHKPSVLLKSEMLVPIHLGRAVSQAFSKDGNSISNEDDLWMKKHLVGDDTGDNISAKNRFYNEMTGIYWAWKNQDQLGNPDYIGFMHYRRFFIFDDACTRDFIKRKISTCYKKQYVFDYLLKKDEENLFSDDVIKKDVIDNDILIPYAINLPHSVQDNLLAHLYLPASVPNDILAVIKRNRPDMFGIAEAVFCSKKLRAWNISVMKKDIFNHYCEWMFSILGELEHQYDFSNSSIFGQRLLAFASERLSTVFFEYLIAQGYKVKDKRSIYIPTPDLAKDIRPAFDNHSEDYIPVVLASDDGSVSNVGVLIKSIIEAASFKNNYEIFILEKNISITNRLLINSLVNGLKNIKIKFINLYAYMTLFDKRLSHLLASDATFLEYAKFSIPVIFQAFNRVLYLANDVLVVSDVAELYRVQMEGKLIAGCSDIKAILMMNSDKGRDHSTINKNYKKVFKDRNTSTLIQDSVVLFDLFKIKQSNMMQKCANIIQNDVLTLSGKDVLNLVFDQQIKFCSLEWNVFSGGGNYSLDQYLPVAIYKNYIDIAVNQPKIIFYDEAYAPWYKMDVPFAHIFWNMALKTPFYGTLMSQVQYKTIDSYIGYYKKHFFRACKYRLMAQITSGKKKNHYLDKIKRLKRA